MVIVDFLVLLAAASLIVVPCAFAQLIDTFTSAGVQPLLEVQALLIQRLIS